MKILVNATANNLRGPFIVTKAFLEELYLNEEFLKKEDITLHVLVSDLSLLKFSCERISLEYMTFPKKSFFHKYYFERFLISKIIKKNHSEFFLSLQNLGIFNKDIKQYVMIQTSLPISNIQFKELDIKNYFKYKVLLNYMFRKNLYKYEKIIVQTNWMKEEVVKRYSGIDKEKVRVINPPANDVINQTKKLPLGIEEKINREFFNLIYITNNDKYKNNDFLVSTIMQFNLNSSRKVTLYLSVEGQDSDHIKYLGKVPYESMYTLYKKMDALIFPSLTETVGLPLIEAKLADLPGIMADLPYAREIWGQDAFYFNPRDCKSLVETLKFFLNEKDKRSVEPQLSYKGESYMSYIQTIIDDNR
ncbi:glycosyltransferase [Planococcus sp. CAU13]|uniref:glycosyltransferase n=1 Tax=Planococcus sp. CAU13 TaxID=1541197 RepID=UPI00052FE48A|nr:glycosyltransferase [Planococcus sp. CAU13]